MRLGSRIGNVTEYPKAPFRSVVSSWPWLQANTHQSDLNIPKTESHPLRGHYRSRCCAIRAIDDRRNNTKGLAKLRLVGNFVRKKSNDDYALFRSPFSACQPFENVVVGAGHTGESSGAVLPRPKQCFISCREGSSTLRHFRCQIRRVSQRAEARAGALVPQFCVTKILDKLSDVPDSARDVMFGFWSTV